MKKLLYCIFIVLPFLCSCIGDDCSTCVEMAYDTRVTLKINKTNSLTKAGSELDVKNIAFFVFNKNGSLNTIKKFTVSMNTGALQNFNLNISSDAKYIYAIANCSDILTSSPTSFIGTQINNSADLKTLFSTLATNHSEIFDGTNLILTGYTDTIIPHVSNPYQYTASITLKPIVSKFSIIVETSGTPPSDYVTSIDYIKTFVLNSRDKASLFDTNISNYNYMHGNYQSFWNGTDFLAESISPIINSNLYSQTFSINNSDTIVFYIPQNDTTFNGKHKTIAVLEVGYKMISIDGTEERFKRFFSVALIPPTNSTLSVARGKHYKISFKLSGKFFGALSPLSSMMSPFSPIPQKNTNGLIYVPQEKYSKIKVSNWE